MSLIRRIRRGERGNAMVAVMGVLLVTTTLGFGVAATADRNTQGTVRDSNVKRALAAAETGLQLGRMRVGAQGTAFANTSCYPVQTADLEPPAPACGWSTWENAGNGARVTFRVSAVLDSSTDGTCVAAVTPPASAIWRQRCVTAIGEMGGERRRLQTRIVENRGAPIFPFPGMFGLDSVNLNQSRAHGTVGSNGSITIGPGARVQNPGHVVLGGSASVTGPYDGTRYQEPPFVADLFDDWYSATVRAPTQGTNDIGSLPGGTVTGQRNANPPNGQGTITLTPGKDYNFCSIAFNSNERFVVPASATEPVRIFVDSAARPNSSSTVSPYYGSSCGAVPKAIDAASGSGFVNQTGKASMLQVYVYSGAIEFHSSAEFIGTLWAPQSNVLFNSGARLEGAMVARNIQYNNNGSTPGFVGDPDADNVTGRWDGTYKRNGWRECPRSGC